MSLPLTILTQNQIVNRVNIFFSAALRHFVVRRYLSVCWLYRCLSSPLMLLFVHHLFEYLFVNSIALTDTIFDQNLTYVAKHHVYKLGGASAMTQF